MDLLGYGKSEAEATKELVELIDSQLSFAHQKRDEGLLTHRAPKEFFERWEKAQAAALRNEILHEKPGKIGDDSVSSARYVAASWRTSAVRR